VKTARYHIELLAFVISMPPFISGHTLLLNDELPRRRRHFFVRRRESAAGAAAGRFPATAFEHVL
jgi:hypothetical protein